VEWTNVSAGYELNCVPDELYESGFAYVAVSAQPIGLTGFERTKAGLLDWDAQRYAGLNIPDEGLCFDIFTQGARAVGPRREIKEIDPMGGLEVRHLIGFGESQSGTRILAYANGVQPLENEFSALMPMLNAGSSADFDAEIAHPDFNEPSAARKSHSRTVISKVRQDTKIPILALNTETEALYYTLAAKQDDSDNFRSWIVTGASHAAFEQMAMMHRISDRDGVSDSMHKYSPYQSSKVEWLPTFGAALNHVLNWVQTGEAPPIAQPMEIDFEARQSKKDEHGNSLGGIRLPEVEVPIARYVAGVGYPLSGFTVPFNEEKLKALYPSHDVYTAGIAAAAKKAWEQGFITESKYEKYIEAAKAAPIPEMPPLPEQRLPSMLKK